MNERCTLADRVATELEQQILQGKWRVGQRLPAERSLCALFGVGRTTVREALKTLAVRGLVTVTSRGAVVADPATVPMPGVDLAALAARASIRDLYEVRKLLEGRVAHWAALRATSADIARLRELVESEPSSQDHPTSAIRAFHEALVVATQNPVLVQVYASSRPLLFRLPFVWRLLDVEAIGSTRAWRHELARQWHQRILQAVEQRDPDAAAEAMFQHLDAMEKDLLARLRTKAGAASSS